MFKRTSKMTALLVAAAAVISIMPTGVNAASSDKIKSEKGEIYKAVAYKDGKFYIGGKPEKKESDAYYLSNSKYSKLDDIDSEDKAQEYGTKYVEVEDGDHYVDLSNGDVTDKKVKENDVDGAATKLRSAVKSDNDGRYNEDDTKSVKDLKELPNSKFAEEWYQAEYKVKEAKDTINGKAANLTVYTNKDGKYIDADYNLGKIRVKLSNNETATVENTNEKDKDVSAKVTDAKVIGQDSNNIYRLAKITLKCATGVTIKEVNSVAVASGADSLVASGESVSFDVIQVISKEQASKRVDGVKVAKSTSSYVLSDKDGKKISLLNDSETGFTVADGKLINYKISGDQIDAEVINLKSKSSVNYIEKGDNDHVLLKDGENSVDIDVNGNIWALAKDYLYKFDNNQDFEKVYDLDEEYTNLSVYDKDNIVVWDADEEIYSIVGKKAESTTIGNDPVIDNNTNNNNNNTTPVTTVTKGWVKDANGRWSYNNADGTKFKGWLQDGGAWYYLEADGIMVTGWKQVGSTWYYLQSSGAMKTGWLDDNGTWYYLDGSGAMLSNTYVGGYRLGTSGAWIK